MLRLIFYCYNGIGLGHIVRSLQIASAAARLGDCQCVIVTGCSHMDQLAIDPRLQVEHLPLMNMVGHGRMVAADPALAHTDVRKLRSERLLAVCRQVQPHCILIDHFPLGLGGELLSVLTSAIEEDWPTRFVWGIPYFLGGVNKSKPGNPAVARAMSHLHSAIAYVDSADIDVLAQCPSWSLPTRRDHVGIVVEPPLEPLETVPGLIVVTCGGGTLALGVCRLVLAARKRATNGEAIRLRFVLGPLADEQTVATMIKGEAHVEVWRTGTVREAIRDAAVVVSRAGYNSSAMLMSTDLPVILVPADKVFVGRDQWPRALRLAALPGIWAIEENHPDAVIQLARAMDAALRQGRVPRQLGWNLNGAETAARWVIAEAQDAQREEEQHRGLMIG